MERFNGKVQWKRLDSLQHKRLLCTIHCRGKNKPHHRVSSCNTTSIPFQHCITSTKIIPLLLHLHLLPPLHHHRLLRHAHLPYASSRLLLLVDKATVIP